MIEGRDLCLAFGEKTVLRGQELTVPAHGRIALMGPSGCGKTTLLRVLAGLQKPDSGSVRVDAARLAFVFQEPRLLPWRTAAQNVNAVLTSWTNDDGTLSAGVRTIYVEQDLDDDPYAARYAQRTEAGMDDGEEIPF